MRTVWFGLVQLGLFKFGLVEFSLVSVWLDLVGWVYSEFVLFGLSQTQKNGEKKKKKVRDRTGVAQHFWASEKL